MCGRLDVGSLITATNVPPTSSAAGQPVRHSRRATVAVRTPLGCAGAPHREHRAERETPEMEKGRVVRAHEREGGLSHGNYIQRVSAPQVSGAERLMIIDATMAAGGNHGFHLHPPQ